jgi:hypothetical protein
MIPIGEAIEILESMYNKGVKSKDSRLSPRLVYSALLSGRAELIRQMSNKTQHINDWIYQTLYKVELEVKPVNLSNSGIKTETILKSKLEIPKIISDMDEELFRSITSLDGNVSYGMSTWSTNKYSSGSKYTANNPRVYVRDAYLYITKIKLIPAITIEGIFEDPLEVYLYNLNNFTDCPDCACKAAMDIEFPIDRNLVTAMLKMAIPELIILLNQVKEDKISNASDDTGSTGSMIHQPQEQQ